jgi:release factor glutamine methyltransferase
MAPSSGDLRRLVHPILLRLWLKHAKEKELVTRIGGLTLRVAPSVFHPRFFGSSIIFAEHLVEIGLEGKRFLDLGTGSGIVGLFAARAGATVTAVDINPRAVECASHNATQAGLSLDCRYSDLFSSLSDQTFDVIAWNPPFFPKPASSLAEAALYAGEDYSVVRRFAEEAPRHLTAAGRVFLILSKDLDIDKWNSIFNGRLQIRRERRWGWETMAVVEVV